MPDSLRQHYLDYLAVLNERRFADLVDFVAEELTYNGRPLTRSEYARQRADEVGAIPDLVFTAELLVVDGDQVACRLEFDCTPARPFLGFVASGQRIRFAEHVFYRFADGLIVSVTSLIDHAAIAAQLALPAEFDRHH